MTTTPDFGRVRARWLPLWALACLLPLVAVAELRAPGWLDTPAGDVAFTYASYAAVAAWALYACARADVRARAFLTPVPGRRHDWRALALVPALLALTIGCVYLVWWPLSFVAPELVASLLRDDEPPTWMADAPLRSALAVLGTVALAPVVEELVFRGVLLHRWARRWNAHRAVLATSLAFGALHADVIGAAAFGAVMALLYVRTGTLWVPIACHAVNNAAAVALELTMDDVSVATIAELRATWHVGALALVGSVLALYALRGLYLPPAGWTLPALAGPSVRSPLAVDDDARLSAASGG